MREEASRYTRTVDMVRIIRARRLKWLGHILRMGPERLIHQAVRFMSDHRRAGDLLMDVPRRYSWEELKELAANRDYWRQRVKALKDGSGVHVEIRGPPPSPRKRKASKCTPSTKVDMEQRGDAYSSFMAPHLLQTIIILSGPSSLQTRRYT